MLASSTAAGALDRRRDLAHPSYSVLPLLHFASGDRSLAVVFAMTAPILVRAASDSPSSSATPASTSPILAARSGAAAAAPSSSSPSSPDSPGRRRSPPPLQPTHPPLLIDAVLSRPGGLAASSESSWCGVVKVGTLSGLRLEMRNGIGPFLVAGDTAVPEIWRSGAAWAGLRGANHLFDDFPKPSIVPSVRGRVCAGVGEVLEASADLNMASTTYLVWEDLTAALPVYNSGQSVKKLIHNLSGYAVPGRIMAIMGPSGSGKSTLLDSLAGRLGRNVVLDGKVMLNGKKRSLDCGVVISSGTTPRLSTACTSGASCW